MKHCNAIYAHPETLWSRHPFFCSIIPIGNLFWIFLAEDGIDFLRSKLPVAYNQKKYHISLH